MFLYIKTNKLVSGESEKNFTLELGPNQRGQILYFLGLKHTNDPGDIQFIQLKQFWDKFLNIAKGECVMFTERTAHDLPAEYGEAVDKYGEVGAAQWLAKKFKVPTICPEPSDIKQREILCKSFDPNTVAYAMVAQNLGGWFRHTRKSKFAEAVERSIKRETKFAKIYGFVPDDAWFNYQHKELFNDQRLEDKVFLDSISDPRKNDTLINSVISTRTRIRNEYILKRITETWESGASIFIVYGRGHFVFLESPLQKLFGN